MADRDPFDLSPKLPEHLSVSQVQAYEEDPYHYYLSRRLGAWEHPAAWFGQGTGVHAAIEAFERSGREMSPADMEAEFIRSYTEEIDRALADCPNTHYWFNSGPYGGAEDIERRLNIGIQQTASYWDWAVLGKGVDEVPWTTPDGQLAIELPFEVDFGGVKVKGYIDQVMEVRPPAPRTPSGAVSKSRSALTAWESQPKILRVRDVKTGVKTPTDWLQLATYGLALDMKYGVTVDGGDYWMARKGGTAGLQDLSAVPRNDIILRYLRAFQGIQAEDWTPNPDKDCSRCGIPICPKYKFYL